jgi:hypothetical protein
MLPVTEGSSSCQWRQRPLWQGGGSVFGARQREAADAEPPPAEAARRTNGLDS